MNVLEEAQGIVQERQASYGSPAPHWNAVAKCWSELLREAGLMPEGKELEGWQACSMMIILKQFRMAKGWHPDSATDTAGYIWCASECAKESKGK